MGRQTQLALVPSVWPEAPPTRYRLKTAMVTLEVRESGGDECCGSVGEAVSILQAIYRQLDADQEHFVVLCLNARNRITGYKVATSGGQDQTTVDAKIVFRFALLFGAAAIIVAHNHPSGTTQPSQHDLDLTRLLALAAQTLALKLHDHIIVEPAGGYYSIAEHQQV
jgi:DNA repair protein RadC